MTAAGDVSDYAAGTVNRDNVIAAFAQLVDVPVASVSLAVSAGSVQLTLGVTAADSATADEIVAAAAPITAAGGATPASLSRTFGVTIEGTGSVGICEMCRPAGAPVTPGIRRQERSVAMAVAAARGQEAAEEAVAAWLVALWLVALWAAAR